MTRYKCPKCTYSDVKNGLCTKCRMPLETACPACDKAMSSCVCVTPNKVRPK